MSEKKTVFEGNNVNIKNAYMWTIHGTPSNKEFVVCKPAQGPIQINPNFKFAFDEYANQQTAEEIYKSAKARFNNLENTIHYCHFDAYHDFKQQLLIHLKSLL